MPTYAYQQSETSYPYAYVKYNITPDFSETVMIGSSITVSGVFYSLKPSSEFVKVYLQSIFFHRNVNKTGGYLAYIPIFGEKKDFAVEHPFSFTFNLPVEVAKVSGTGETFDVYLQLVLGTEVNSGAGYSTNFPLAEEQRYTVIDDYVAPALTGFSFGDAYTAVSPTPLSKFDDYVQGISKPVFTIINGENLTHDSRVGRVYRVIFEVFSGSTVLYSATFYPTYSEIESHVLTMGAIQQFGTITWRCSLRDNIGVTGISTGSFVVLPYVLPSISTINVERYKSVLNDEEQLDYVASDDGENVWITISADVAAVADKNAWTLKIDYGRTDGGGDITTIIPLTGTDGSIETIRKIEDRTLLTEDISAANDYTFLVTLTDYLGNTQQTRYVYKAGGIFAVEKFGVSVGMRPTSTLERPMFQSAWPIQALDGVIDADGKPIGSADYSSDRIDTNKKWINGKSIYQKVFLFGLLGTGVSLDIPIGEPAIDEIIALYGFHGVSTVEMLPFVHQSNLAYQKALTIASLESNPLIQLRQGSGAQTPTGGYIVLEYVPFDSTKEWRKKSMAAASENGCSVSSSTQNSATYAAVKGFTLSGSEYWSSTLEDSARWIQMQMPAGRKNIVIILCNSLSANTAANIKSGEFYGSNDGSSWTKIGEFTNRPNDRILGLTVHKLKNQVAYSYIRLVVTDPAVNVDKARISRFIVYGDIP